ncbi:MAG: AAA family ATPase, partial [Bacteroidetes bacterium]|nr:AAA family ATPase [Bacteroidota bacterium]
MTTYKNEKEAIDGLLAKYKQLSSEIKKIIIGQDVVIRSVLTSVF